MYDRLLLAGARQLSSQSNMSPEVFWPAAVVLVFILCCICGSNSRRGIDESSEASGTPEIELQF